MTRVTSGAGKSKLNKYTLLGAFRDFVLLVKNFVLFDYSNGKYHKNQVVQVLPYQFEPEPGLQTSNSELKQATFLSTRTAAGSKLRRYRWRMLASAVLV